MTNSETWVLISARLHQARTALEDAKFLLQGKRSAQEKVYRANYSGS